MNLESETRLVHVPLPNLAFHVLDSQLHHPRRTFSLGHGLGPAERCVLILWQRYIFAAHSRDEHSMLIDLLADPIHRGDTKGDEYHIALGQTRRHYILGLNEQ